MLRWGYVIFSLHLINHGISCQVFFFYLNSLMNKNDKALLSYCHPGRKRRHHNPLINRITFYIWELWCKLSYVRIHLLLAQPNDEKTFQKFMNFSGLNKKVLSKHADNRAGSRCPRRDVTKRGNQYPIEQLDCFCRLKQRFTVN